MPISFSSPTDRNARARGVGADAVALVTGEEKIKPSNPRFWVSTVEAMPRDLAVAFVAIDEVQLGADLERGHVFTDRMLIRRRGVLGRGGLRHRRTDPAAARRRRRGARRAQSAYPQRPGGAVSGRRGRVPR